VASVICYLLLGHKLLCAHIDLPLVIAMACLVINVVNAARLLVNQQIGIAIFGDKRYVTLFSVEMSVHDRP